MNDSISEYLDAIWLQRDLSENTLLAYRRDLHLVQRWLGDSNKTLLTASTADLQRFMAERLRPVKSALVALRAG